MRMDERTKEIRQILLGRFQRKEDGSLAAAPKGNHWRPGGFQGLSVGWGAVHFLGISHSKLDCSLSSGVQKAQLDAAMQTLGQVVQLEKSPGISACLCQHWMAAPVLLTAACEGTNIEMSAYTTRGVLASLVCRRTLRMLESRLTGTTKTENGKEETAGRKKREKRSSSRKR